MKDVIQKNRLSYITLSIPIVIFFILAMFCKDLIDNIDFKILEIIRKIIAFNTMTTVMNYITNMSSVTILCTISILILLFVRNKEIGLLISVNLGLITTTNYILKYIFNRQRPLGFMLVDQSGYSFPSGHSMVSIAFYGFLIYLIQKNFKNNKVKRIITFALTFLIILIAFSRIYLGVHYPSDVIVGLYLGYVYLILFISYTKKYI